MPPKSDSSDCWCVLGLDRAPARRRSTRPRATGSTSAYRRGTNRKSIPAAAAMKTTTSPTSSRPRPCSTQPSEREQRDRVRDGVQADVSGSTGARRGARRRGRSRPSPNTGRAAAPRSIQTSRRDQEERRDVEHVPLLDPERLLGGEDRDLERRARRPRRGRRDEDLLRPRRARAGRTRAASSAANGHDAERRGRARTTWYRNHRVDVARRVVRRARDLVGAEDAERRPAARELLDRARRRAAPSTIQYVASARSARDGRRAPATSSSGAARIAGTSAIACARVRYASRRAASSRNCCPALGRSSRRTSASTRREEDG